ncbi:MAG TPA: 23S rRNA (pseudouridine(1915)-N(3))-methyltransferase RlmH [Alphaproteobacteria bacterium]|jgi:23S rRNA (pseudouridine1915-N3)-methyltransferase
MRLQILAVGKAKAGPQRDLYDLYAGRLRWPLRLVEVEEKRKLAADALKAREAELLLAQLPAGAKLCALDEHGTAVGSADFAGWLRQWQDQGAADVAFAIGGADGHGAALLARADRKLALGALTWPHMLVRGMLAEQLYRAQQILAGHPYHRE